MNDKKIYCEDCGADITYGLRYELNNHLYCEFCVEEVADEEWSDLTAREKVDFLGGEWHNI